MSLDIKKQNLFSTLYGSDPCDDIKVSQTTIQFIREHILAKQPQKPHQSPQQPLTQSQTASSLASRWNTDSEHYSGNLKL